MVIILSVAKGFKWVGGAAGEAPVCLAALGIDKYRTTLGQGRTAYANGLAIALPNAR